MLRLLRSVASSLALTTEAEADASPPVQGDFRSQTRRRRGALGVGAHELLRDDPWSALLPPRLLTHAGGEGDIEAHRAGHPEHMPLLAQRG